MNNEIKHIEKENEELLNENDLKESEILSLNNRLNELKSADEKYHSTIKPFCENKDIFYSNILKLEDKILKGETDVRIAYITVDDGPNSDTTPQWMEILGRYDILVTFFVNMKDGLDEQYIEMINNGHVLGNHTTTHDIFGDKGVYSGLENFKMNITDNYDFLKEEFGYETDLFRFPGGSSETTYLKQDKKAYVQTVYDLGYGYVDWNASADDGNRKNSSSHIYKSTIKTIKNRKIACILMHDDSVNTLEALPEIIETLMDKGYIFLPLQHDSYIVWNS